MPAPTRRARSSAPERYYVGRRPSRSEVYVVSRTELEPLAHLRYRSDAPFDWGSFSEGALELAFAILAHTTESRPTELVCQAFCGEVVACLDPAGFVLSYGEIALRLLTAFGDGDASPDEPAPGRPGGASPSRRKPDSVVAEAYMSTEGPGAVRSCCNPILIVDRCLRCHRGARPESASLLAPRAISRRA